MTGIRAKLMVLDGEDSDRRNFVGCDDDGGDGEVIQNLYRCLCN